MVEASSNEDLAAVEQPQDGDDVEDDNVDVVMDVSEVDGKEDNIRSESNR